MDAIIRLREMGFWVRVEGDKIKVRWTGPGNAPDAAPLLDALRKRKAEALAILRGEVRPARPWTWAGPDPDNSGQFIAWREGEFDHLIGRGETQLDACLSLWDAEETLERARR